MKFPRFPSYKPASAQWLTEIPSHWDEKPLGRLVRFMGGATPDKNKPEYWDGCIPWVSPKDMKVSTISDAVDHVSEEALANSPLRYVPSGAVLIVVRGMILAHSFPVAVTAETVTINQDMKALLPSRAIGPRYLLWALSGIRHVFVASADESAHGTRKLETEVVGRVTIALPPPADQAAIADFLDRETAKIDALITKKRTLIERLQEKRTALISRTVTRGLPPAAARAAGLDPNPKLKPSGIDWLGHIPAHWEIRPLSTVSRFQSGKAHEPFVDDDGEFVCVNSRFVSTEGHTRKFCTKNLSPARINDVLMVMSDLPNGRALAKAFYVTEDNRYAVNQRVCILSATGIQPRFLFHQLNRSPAFLAYDDGTNQTHLPNSAFTKCPVLVPPAGEQAAITAFLDDAMSILNDMARKIEAAIERLQEYRIALVTAAVTGKVDVRSLAQ